MKKTPQNTIQIALQEWEYVTEIETDYKCDNMDNNVESSLFENVRIKNGRFESKFAGHVNMRKHLQGQAQSILERVASNTKNTKTRVKQDDNAHSSDSSEYVAGDCQTNSMQTFEKQHEQMEFDYSLLSGALNEGVVFAPQHEASDNDSLTQHTDLNGSICKVVKRLENVFSKHKPIIKYLDRALFLHINPQRFEQLLSNLITNAFQAIDLNGQVVVTSRVTQTHLYLDVTDTGMGIQVCDQAKVFDPFYTTKKQHMSTGLGLAIAKQVAYEEGGQLLLSSKPKVGSVFSFVYPLDGAQIH